MELCSRGGNKYVATKITNLAARALHQRDDLVLRYLRHAVLEGDDAMLGVDRRRGE